MSEIAKIKQFLIDSTIDFDEKIDLKIKNMDKKKGGGQ